MPYLTDLMRKNNVYAHIEDIATSGSNKVDRIVYALQGLMEHGRITFNVDEDWAELKREMMGFPSQKVHDDLLDATAMVAHLAQVIYGNKNAEEEEWEPVDMVAGI